MSGDGQIEVRSIGRKLEFFAASPRAMQRGRVQTHSQWSDALYAPRLRFFERPSLGGDISDSAPIGIAISSMGGVASVALTAPAFGPYSDLIAIGVGIAAGAAALVTAGVSAAIIPKARRARERMAQTIAADFGAWAKARYGLELSAATLDSLVEFVAYAKAAPAQRTFEHHGHTFKVVAHDGRFYIEQARDVSALDYAGGNEVGEDHFPRVAELPGEAGLLGSRLLELVATTAGERLTPEEDHILRRVREDTLQAVALHDRLVWLRAVDDQSIEALRDTLASLTGEVDGIITHWRVEARGELEVQRAYVRERQLHTPAHLALPAKEATATPVESAVASMKVGGE